MKNIFTVIKAGLTALMVSAVSLGGASQDKRHEDDYAPSDRNRPEDSGKSLKCVCTDTEDASQSIFMIKPITIDPTKVLKQGCGGGGNGTGGNGRN